MYGQRRARAWLGTSKNPASNGHRPAEMKARHRLTSGRSSNMAANILCTQSPWAMTGARTAMATAAHPPSQKMPVNPPGSCRLRNRSGSEKIPATKSRYDTGTECWVGRMVCRLSVFSSSSTSMGFGSGAAMVFEMQQESGRAVGWRSRVSLYSFSTLHSAYPELASANQNYPRCRQHSKSYEWWSRARHNNQPNICPSKNQSNFW